MIRPAPKVRRAGPADVPGIAAALARGFYEDPVQAWFFPDDSRRLDRSRRFFHHRVGMLLDQEQVYTTDDHAGAAIWTLPDRWRVPFATGLRFGLRAVPLIGRRSLLVLRGWERVEAEHPAAPHWYLAILGVDRSLQRTGVGSALLEPILDGCDRDEVPAYLESSNEANIPFYARHGFRVTGEVRMPRGPSVWPMWRDPRP
ncbi:MAG TPA: GNAT family N-acetyltransferase [Thermoleophilaceae bacterium]